MKKNGKVEFQAMGEKYFLKKFTPTSHLFRLDFQNHCPVLP
jgi:hypothetical protein